MIAHWIAGLASRLRALRDPGRFRADTAEEIEFHLEAATQRNIDRGMTPNEAARAARRAFGGLGSVESTKEAVRRESGVRWLQDVGADVRYAARGLRRRPGFTIACTLTLALGVGANAAIFAVFNSVLLRPLPYPDPEELISIQHTAPGMGLDLLGQSAGQHVMYQDEATTLQAVGMWETGAVSVTEIGAPEEVQAVTATSAVLSMLRVTADQGRIFTEADDSPSASETALVSFGYWRDRLGSDPAAIGRSIRIDGRAREIIGVLPEGFRFLDMEPTVVLPMQLDPSTVRNGVWRFTGIARLAPGATLEAADAELARLGLLSFERFPGGLSRTMMEEASLAPRLLPLKDAVLGDVGPALWTLVAMVGLVLLIACANVTNLFLVHTERARRDLSVRIALGASFGRTVRGFLVEGLMLAGLGAAVGLALAMGGVRLLRWLDPADLPRLAEIGVDGSVIGFTIVVSLVATLLFTLIPVLHHRRPDLGKALKSGTRGAGDSARRHRLRNGLAAAEVAIALVLVIGSGLMIRSFQTLRAVEPGFENADEVLTFRLTLPEAEIADPERVAGTHAAIAQALEAIPGVSSVGAITAPPMDPRQNDDVVYVDDFPTPVGELPPLRRYKRVAGDYFAAMGIETRAGRRIDQRDAQDRADVVVVSESLALAYWDSAEAAVGRSVREWYSGRPRTIVGVVADVRDDGVDQPAPPTIYFPTAALDLVFPDLNVARTRTYVVRSDRAGALSLLPQVRDAVWEINPNVPLADARTMQSIVSDSMARTSFVLTLLGIATAMALLLGMIGIYGVISYVVSQRTREIGVRVALGADHRRVVRMVLREGTTVILVGAVAGVLVSLAAGGYMSSLLFGVSVTDPLTYALAFASVAAVAILATYIPARRASRVDPIQALRVE